MRTYAIFVTPGRSGYLKSEADFQATACYESTLPDCSDSSNLASYSGLTREHAIQWLVDEGPKRWGTFAQGVEP